MKHPNPNPEQVAALVKFAEREGRSWQSKLRDCWMLASYPADRETSHLLQQVRNQFGPVWLEKINLAALKQMAAGATPEGCLAKIVQHLQKIGAGIYIDARFYQARVNNGVLEVHDGFHWHEVPKGAQFRDHEGRDLFTYEVP